MTVHKWSAMDIHDLTGRTIVVTGASSGLGEVTARELAKAGAHVVLAVRNVQKGQKVADAIDGSTEVRELDLSDLRSVHAFAEAWTGDIDVLVNNAGVMALPYGKTKDGFEIQIGTNYLGHFALTNLLLPHVTDRVINVSSVLNPLGHIDLDDLNWERRKYKTWRAYGQSKLASLLITAELQRRLTAAGSRVRALTAHPGVAVTSLDDHLTGYQAFLFKIAVLVNGKSVDQGVLPILYAATQDLPGDAYIGPAERRDNAPAEVKRTKAERDVVTGQRLWELSESLTSTKLGGS
jgi:NAD(P)-dependent dehydrogenase (short-subunit alcohol dehydrogenase family)